MYKLIEKEYRESSIAIGYGYYCNTLIEAESLMISKAKGFIIEQCYFNDCSAEDLKCDVKHNKKRNGITVRSKTKYQTRYEIREYEIVSE